LGGVNTWDLVRRSNIEAIDKIRSKIPKMTILYDSEEEILIMKFMVGVKHEMCAGLLNNVFEKLVDTRTGDDLTLIAMKSSRYKGPRREEGDNSYKPLTCIMKSNWPTIVFEMGVSESLAQLQLNAKFWIEASQGKTLVVIIAFIDRVAESIFIERWQDAPRAALQRQPARNRDVITDVFG
jgi:hypothetical protein